MFTGVLLFVAVIPDTRAQLSSIELNAERFVKTVDGFYLVKLLCVQFNGRCVFRIFSKFIHTARPEMRESARDGRDSRLLIINLQYSISLIRGDTRLSELKAER